MYMRCEYLRALNLSLISLALCSELLSKLQKALLLAIIDLSPLGEFLIFLSYVAAARCARSHLC